MRCAQLVEIVNQLQVLRKQCRAALDIEPLRTVLVEAVLTTSRLEDKGLCAIKIDNSQY